MSARPIVSYADISLPYDSPEPTSAPNPPRNNQQPPKKRKKGNTKSKGRSAYGESSKRVEDEESRELTHQEIWDDSALIDAWNAANDEYEAYHGPEKDWKKEAVSTSPLWYNIPPSPSSKAQNVEQDTSGNDEEYEPAPTLNDPGAADDAHIYPQQPSMDYGYPSTSSDPSTQMGPTEAAAIVGQDEAFTRALNAMYWGGYWTAVYHCHRKLGPGAPASQAKPQAAAESSVTLKEEELVEEYLDQDQEMEEIDEEASSSEENGFVSTQR